MVCRSVGFHLGVRMLHVSHVTNLMFSRTNESWTKESIIIAV